MPAEPRPGASELVAPRPERRVPGRQAADRHARPSSCPGSRCRRIRVPSAGDLVQSPSPNAEVLDWVLALWTERLVGGEPPHPSEPPVILALSSLSPPCSTAFATLSVWPGSLLLVIRRTMADSRPGRTRQAWYEDWFLHQSWPRKRRPESSAGEISTGQPGRTRARVPAQTGGARPDVDCPTAHRSRAAPRSVGVAACPLPDRQANPVDHGSEDEPDRRSTSRWSRSSCTRPGSGWPQIDTVEPPSKSRRTKSEDRDAD